MLPSVRAVRKPDPWRERRYESRKQRGQGGTATEGLPAALCRVSQAVRELTARLPPVRKRRLSWLLSWGDCCKPARLCAAGHGPHVRCSVGGKLDPARPSPATTAPPCPGGQASSVPVPLVQGDLVDLCNCAQARRTKGLPLPCRRWMRRSRSHSQAPGG